MKVLQVAAGYPPYLGGVETHVSEIAPRLAARGMSVTVLTTDRSCRLPATEEAGGVLIRRVPAWPRTRDYFFAPGVYRVIAAGGWDLVHCQGYHTLVAPLAMLAARRARIPYILTFHSGGHSSRLRNALRGVQLLILRPLLAGAARLIAVSEWELEHFARRLRFSRRRFGLIANGVQLPDAFLANASEGGRAPLVVSAGRLERYKGHDRVLAALPFVAAEYPAVRLRIAGDGPDAPRLRRLVAELGLGDRVEIGPVASTDRGGMAALFADAAVVVALSEYESQGIAAFEALALGRPLVVARTSALASLAERGLARGIPFDSQPRETAAAIVAQIRSPVTAPEQSLTTWDACAESLAVLYRQIVDAGPCAS